MFRGFRYCMWSRCCWICLKFVRAEWKTAFIEDNVSGGNDASGVQIKASISTVIRWIPEKDAGCGLRAELVWCNGCLVGETETAEHPDVAVIRWSTEQKLKRSNGATRLTWSAVNKVGSSR
jgi:hypothetical protein